jgi:hypothetical protein
MSGVFRFAASLSIAVWAATAAAETVFVIPSSSRFPGSYYVENGNYFYRGASSYDVADGTVVSRGECVHVADLAKRLEHEARTMCHDMADNYREMPNYPETYREAYRIWQLAKQLSESKEDIDQATASMIVRDLDSRFQPVRREVSGWSVPQSRQRGQGTLQAKSHRAEAIIHHLLNDVGPAKGTWVARADVVAPRLSAPQNGVETMVR